MGRQAHTGAGVDMDGADTVLATVLRRTGGVATALQVEVLMARGPAAEEDTDRGPAEEVDTVLGAATAETECEVDGHHPRATREAGRMTADLRRQMHMATTRRVGKPLQLRPALRMEITRLVEMALRLRQVLHMEIISPVERDHRLHRPLYMEITLGDGKPLRPHRVAHMVRIRQCRTPRWAQ